jgi:hypothetical protein
MKNITFMLADSDHLEHRYFHEKLVRILKRKNPLQTNLQRV